MKLGDLRRKLVARSAQGVGRAMRKARTLKSDFSDLLSVPIEPVRFPVSDEHTKGPEEPEPQLGDATRPAQIYGRESCPWTGRARALLERENVDFDYIDLDAPVNQAFTSRLVVETKQNKNPYIFLRGHFVGGFTALDEIHRLGQLPSYLLTAKQRASQGSRIRIEITSRDDHDDRPPGER